MLVSTFYLKFVALSKAPMKAVILALGNSSSDIAGIFEACTISPETEFGARI